MSEFEATTHYFRQAAQVMELSDRVQLLLINPDKEIKVEVAIELERYPAIETLEQEMARAGFLGIETIEVAREYDLVDAQSYRDRAFSSLLLIDDDAFQRGLHRLEHELAHGPVRCLSLYTIIWGMLPRA